MPGYVIVLSSGDLADALIRADDDEAAKAYVEEGERIHRMRNDVASAIGLPKTPGRYAGLLGRWLLRGPNL